MKVSGTRVGRAGFVREAVMCGGPVARGGAGVATPWFALPSTPTTCVKRGRRRLRGNRCSRSVIAGAFEI